MIKKIYRLLAACLMLLCLPFNGFSNSSESHEVFKYFDALDTYSATFSQLSWQEGRSGFDKTSESIGKVYLKRPDLFRWNYELPDEMQILSDGEFFYHYDVLLMQATKRPLEALEDNRLLLLLNQHQPSDIFTIEALDIKTVSEKLFNGLNQPHVALDYYELKEKREAASTNDDWSEFSVVVVGMSAENEFAYMAMKDNLGVIEFYFSDVHANQTLDNAMFELDVSDDVDILESM